MTVLEVATRLAASGVEGFSVRSPADMRRACRLAYSYAARGKIRSLKIGGSLRFLSDDVDRAARDGFPPRSRSASDE
jgi:hypothetical protein